MLTPVEKASTGAEFEIIYHVPVHDSPLYAITVCLLLDSHLTPIARGVSIMSPREEQKEFRTMMKNGYHRAHGRAVAAIVEWNEGRAVRDHADILCARFTVTGGFHPIFVARQLFKRKLEAHPTTITQQEQYEIEALSKRLRESPKYLNRIAKQ